MRLSHLIYTLRPCLIHTCHAMLRPCISSQDHSTARPSRDVRAVLWSWEERHGRSMAWHGMTSVNQTRPHCVNQMGKTHSKLLVARHGRGTAWERHAMCKSALTVQIQTTDRVLLIFCVSTLKIQPANSFPRVRHRASSVPTRWHCPVPRHISFNDVTWELGF